MFALINTTTEQVEAIEPMTYAAAEARNDSLRTLHEPVRWVPQSDVVLRRRGRDQTGEN